MIIIFPNLHKWKKILQYDMLLFNILIIILKGDSQDATN